MLVSFWVLARSCETRHPLANPFELDMEVTKTKLCNNDGFCAIYFSSCKIFLTLQVYV